MANKPLSAEEFDARFDAGEDMWEFVEERRRNPVEETIDLELAAGEPLLTRLQHEAELAGTSRDALIRQWLTERLDAAA